VSDLLVGLAGGAIGSALTILYGLILRFRAVPGEVDEHDRLARQRDQDLAQWVADDHLRLTRELRRTTAKMASPGEGQGSQLYSGAHARALAHAKERALHAHRDQERAAQRFVDELAAKETWLHRDHRRQRGRAPLRLTAPERVQPVLDRWRDSSWRHPPGVAAAEVNDPTRRTLERTIAELEAGGGSKEPT
jgi:hypothetical protein